jgi:hypothetical protein
MTVDFELPRQRGGDAATPSTDRPAAGISLPKRPEAVEVEIELTNVCNASCSVCPRDDMPPAGMLSEETLERILDLYVELRERHSLNRVLPGSDDRWPRVTVAGGGEPMIHPRAIDLLARMTERGFPVHLITNASRIDDRRLAALLDTDVSSIAVSFWGVREDEYEAAMKLPYARTLERVERLAAGAREAGIPLTITWVATSSLRSTPAEIRAFWEERGIAVDMGDHETWNRGGLVQLDGHPAPGVADRLPDPRRPVWCADLYFTDAWTWAGDCVLCCCNYFTSDRYFLGNVATHGLEELAAKKGEILRSRPLPAMCAVCEQPRRTQATWLAEPWLPFLDPEERAMVTYDPAWSPAGDTAEGAQR